jgi:hypothetical protein
VSGSLSLLVIVLVLLNVQPVHHLLYALEVAGGGGRLRFGRVGARPRRRRHRAGSGLARGRVAQTPRVRAGGDRLEGAAQRRRTHPRVVGQRVGGEPVAPFEVVVQRRGRGEVMGVRMGQVLVVGEESGMLSCQGELSVEEEAGVHAGAVRPREQTEMGGEGGTAGARVDAGRVQVRE